MGLRRIDCFLAAAQLKSFSAAAKYLFLSQSAVSQQIAALENEWGFPLFERNGGRAELTPAGEYLFPHLSSMREVFESHIGNARDLAKEGDEILSIGFDNLIAGNWISNILKHLFSDPSFTAKPHLYGENLSNLTNRLINGTVDIAFTTDIEIAKLEVSSFTPLSAASPCVYFPPKHKFERMNYITVEDLASENVIGAYGKHNGVGLSASGTYLESLGLPSEGLTLYNDGDTVFLAVMAHMGVFIASHLCDEYAKRYGALSVDLVSSLPEVTLGVVCRKDTNATRKFLEVTKGILNDAC